MAGLGAGGPAPGLAAGTDLKLPRGGARMRPDEREVAPAAWGGAVDPIYSPHPKCGVLVFLAHVHLLLLPPLALRTPRSISISFSISICLWTARCLSLSAALSISLSLSLSLSLSFSACL